MVKRLSGTARRELEVAVGTRYRSSAPTEKRLILREFSAITGYQRKSAIRILNGAAENNSSPGRESLDLLSWDPEKSLLQA